MNSLKNEMKKKIVNIQLDLDRIDFLSNPKVGLTIQWDLDIATFDIRNSSQIPTINFLTKSDVD